MMTVLVGLVRTIDAINERIGQAVSWLTLGCVLVCFAVVVLRYGFGIGFLWMQELYVWFHAGVFMLGAGFTYLHGGHVRVDILFGRLSPRGKAWTDIFGTLVFLFPWLAVVVYWGIPFFMASWNINEVSMQAGGMPYLWLMKAIVLGFCAVLGIQGVAHLARSVLVLNGHPEFLPEEGEA